MRLIADFHFYDEVLEGFVTDLYTPGLEKTPFAFAIASYLYETVLFTESLYIDECPNINYTFMANMLYEEAERYDTYIKTKKPKG